MRFPLIAGIFVTLLSGCSLLGGGAVTEDNFNDEYAKVSCKITQDCSKGYFEATWDDLDDCIDDLVDQAEEYEDYYDDCDFDEDKAQDCMNSLKSAECGDIYEGDEDIYEDCLEIWDCE